MATQPLPPNQDPGRLIARIIQYGGIPVGLLAALPNWDTEIKISLEMPTDVSKEPITFTESRRNFAQSARYRMEWTSYLPSAADVTELRIFLTRIRELPVMVPLWTDVCEVQTAITTGTRSILLRDLPARFGAFWIITDENFLAWEILIVSSLNLTTRIVTLPVSGVSRGYPAGTLMYPLLTGRLEEQPRPEAITDETADVSFKIKENSNFDVRILPATAAIQTVGTNIPAFATTPKWNVTPNHVRPLDWTEMPDIVYEHVGFLRTEQQRVYDHRTARGQELEFYQNDRAVTSKIEYFWRDRRATTLRFMIPTYRGDLRVSENTPVTGQPTWIRCERSYFANPGRESQPGDQFIALIDDTDAVIPYQLTSAIDEPNNNSCHLVCTTNVVARTFTKIILSHLLLARFVEPTLEWTYTTPYLATTRLKFMELPHEYANPPTPLPEPAYLFIFTEEGIRTDRFTSYENRIVIPTGVYTGTYNPAPFSFDTVKEGLKLDQEKLEFKSFKFEGNPLNKMWPFALDAILTVEIVEVNALNPGSNTAITRFYGDVWSVDSDYKAIAVPFGNLFDRKFPRFLLSVSDNYTQFSPPTKITPTAFKILGTIHNPPPPFNIRTSQTVTVTSTIGHAKATEWFSGGWLETGTGANKEKRGILHSAPASGSDLNLHIDRPLLKANQGQSLDMYPGYDASIDQCETKFNNRINFGGHPFIPNVNPGVKAIKPKETAGGKKG